MNKKIVNGTVKHMVGKLYEEAEKCSKTMDYEDFKVVEDMRNLLYCLSTMNEEIETLKRQNHELRKKLNIVKE